MERIVYVHAGTHKTGTTSIQAMLSENTATLAAAGVYIPQAGRATPGLAAHHNIAFELCQNPQFDPAHGTLDELLTEITTCGAPSVCLSSEEFEALSFNRGGLRRLFTGLLGLGYEVRVVLYLRPQADYLESLYATMAVGGWPVAFAAFIDAMLERGSYGESSVDYLRLVDAFADEVHRDRLILRPYRADEPPATLLHEFISIVGGGEVECATFSWPGKLNAKLTFDSVLASRNLRLDHVDPSVPFEPLTGADILHVVRRFARGNALLNERYGVRVPAVTSRRMRREIDTTMSGSESLMRRRRLIREIASGESPKARLRSAAQTSVTIAALIAFAAITTSGTGDASPKGLVLPHSAHGAFGSPFEPVAARGEELVESRLP